MKRINAFPCSWAGWVALALVTMGASARAEEIPLQALQNWKVYNNAGWVLLYSGKYDKAEMRFRAAIDEIRDYSKDDQRLLARSYNDLARVLYHQGRYAEAEPLAKWALLVRESHPKVNPDAVFQTLYTLALIHKAQDHFNQAEPLLRRALELQEKSIGPKHIQTAGTVDELADVCAEQRKFKDAEELYQRAISIYQRAISMYQRFDPEVNRNLASCSERYATMLDRMGRSAEAAKLRARAKEIRELSEDTMPRPEFKGFR
jgi:tetratricopeptide (TPR) repeat protein